MLAFVPFQLLLNAIGWILAWIYGAVGSFGISIILLTILIRVVLLPLGIKQIKSMQAMQSIQPKVKELQKKYKGNKQKQQEETMKLYKDAGVNPLGGCLPVLLQFPLLIAMYAVIRPPILIPVTSAGVEITANQTVDHYIVHNSHIPNDTQLYQDILTHQTGSFLGMNLQCSPIQAGGGNVPTKDSQRNNLSTTSLPIETPANVALPFNPTTQGGTIACGGTPLSRAPYYLFLLAMILTTFYQQRQMQKASPPGAQTGQQQTIMKIMPIMFGVFGLQFAAGLLVYWTTANLWQIGQQYALLKLGHIGPDALDRRIAEQRAKGDQPAKQGFMSKLMAQAETQRAERDKNTGKSGRQTPPKGSTPRSTKGTRGTRSPKPGGSQTPKRRPNTGNTPPKPDTKNNPGGSA